MPEKLTGDRSIRGSVSGRTAMAVAKESQNHRRRPGSVSGDSERENSMWCSISGEVSGKNKWAGWSTGKNKWAGWSTKDHPCCFLSFVQSVKAGGQGQKTRG